MVRFAVGTQRASEALYGVLASCLPGRTTGKWCEAFARLDIPHARLTTLQELLRDPHLDAIEFFRPRDDLAQRVRSVPQPVLFEDVEEVPDKAPPTLGADADAVLAGIGYSRQQVAELRALGAIAVDA